MHAAQLTALGSLYIKCFLPRHKSHENWIQHTSFERDFMILHEFRLNPTNSVQ